MSSGKEGEEKGRCRLWRRQGEVWKQRVVKGKEVAMWWQDFKGRVEVKQY